MAKRLGIYIHIPFCASKCSYCDFYSLAGCEHLMPEYHKALLAHLDESAKSIKNYEVDSIYFGGGTPSFYGADRIIEIFNALKLNGNVRLDAEVTIEVNPDSISLNALKLLREEGVNRLSIGVQASDNNLLKLIGRRHNFQQAQTAVANARKAGFDNVSLDLIYGLPSQMKSDWAQTLAKVIELHPEHLSCYGLKVEEGTPLYRVACRDESLEPDEDFQAACMDAARERLSAAGYHPYEVASYALDGHECAHNIAYWTGQGYLGLGRSAAGMLDAEDFDRLAGLFPDVLARGDAYRVRLVQRDDAATTFDAEYLSQREAAAEDLMLACRMTRGIGPDLLVRSASVIAADELAAACDRAVELGLATWVPDHIEGHAGRVTSKDVIAGRVRARLAPTHLGWLDGNVLFELFWGLA